MNSETCSLSLLIDITQLLHANKCTYSESEYIANSLLSLLREQREHYEYDTATDWHNQKKSRSADNHIINPLNHVPPYF